ncbi:hypothetical protein [Hoeflea alexandrii]|uniref:Uncharacterized protein n=1 Tax=Hoeflea alexandrii TaxID=288436 RepID=A0ABT1CUR7_9HYPH|nr:hypothetical protein [Hoeflea alexandrii]MCO6409945.1 hypothetical protein [Hoeflea alexandrii]MCY0152937.1 hypothetical protein [Hoeflea alexandrii]
MNLADKIELTAATGFLQQAPHMSACGVDRYPGPFGMSDHGEPFDQAFKKLALSRRNAKDLRKGNEIRLFFGNHRPQTRGKVKNRLVREMFEYLVHPRKLGRVIVKVEQAAVANEAGQGFPRITKLIAGRLPSAGCAVFRV